jgi:hypothetical protein
MSHVTSKKDQNNMSTTTYQFCNPAIPEYLASKGWEITNNRFSITAAKGDLKLVITRNFVNIEHDMTIGPKSISCVFEDLHTMTGAQFIADIGERVLNLVAFNYM